MKLRVGLFLWSVSLFLIPFAQAQEESDPLFTLQSDDPVVAHSSDFNDWDGRYTDPGAVFYYDGLFRMFRNGFRGWPASVQIGYLTSPDGITWTEMSAEPVLTTAEVPYAGVAALASSALVQADGTWVIYFYNWNKATRAPADGTIGRATASDPLGPWTVDPEPVLSPGSEGSWDSQHVDAPQVIQTADGYIMFYGGWDATMNRIGMATSADGISWTKYDDPTTTAAPFAESDPVMTSDQAGFRYHQPRVEKTDAGYVMIFRIAALAGGGNMSLGIATSPDGIQWTVITDEPFWGRNTIPRSNGFWFTATAYHDEMLYLYIEGGRGSYTDIYVATAPLSTLEG